METKSRPFIRRDGINWISLTRLHAFSHWCRRRSFLSQLAGFLYRIGALLDFFELGHRNGVSPFADPSFLQDAEVDRVFPGHLRDAGARRRADVLGCNTPNPSPVRRQRWRSA